MPRGETLKQTCLNLGYITSIQFMNQQVLFYNSGRTPTQIATTTATATTTTMPYLILQFAQGIILYKHDQTEFFKTHISRWHQTVKTQQLISNIKTYTHPIHQSACHWMLRWSHEILFPQYFSQWRVPLS
mmetsp:Transcript_18796/g.27846  ORF Transcript_18796/g.27846 Transcript_18796/m.27846 type:complete len:130 (+) Transcript_18796:54-443(+)